MTSGIARWQTGAVLEELGETAWPWCMTRAEPLQGKQIDELRQTFGAAW